MKFWQRLLVSLGVLLVGLIATPQAFAGTDLTVNCPAVGTCSISPAATPLYNEAGWIPGSTITQKLTVTNSSGQSGFTAIQVENYTETKQLGKVIDITIRQGSPAGPVVYTASNLWIFRDAGYFTISGINPGQTIDYYFTATMSPAAGNEFQASMVKFDIKTGLELVFIPPTNSGGGGNGSVAGATSPANPPVCTDNPPSSAPNLTIVSTGTNTVTLSWTTVSPVTHYGIFFTRTSDGAQYGASNIGNVTTYTITNLSGGANYAFQVFGVNGCAPGPRSSGTTQAVSGPFIATRPIGAGGQVLGTTAASATPSPSATPEPSVSPSPEGQILGSETSACTNWKQYIPWILLIAQLLLLLIVEYWYRSEGGLVRYAVLGAITVVSIILFYLLRECPCWSGQSWLAWLCTWYWLVALILTALVRVFAYAFLDETGESEPKKPTTTIDADK